MKFVTSGSRHRGEDKAIMAKREEVYEQAQQGNPNRWSAKTRNWDHISEVSLNQVKGKSESFGKRRAKVDVSTILKISVGKIKNLVGV